MATTKPKADKATDKPDPDASTPYVSTGGATFAEAAAAATPDEGPGYWGVSPERERTGLADKGLSQAHILDNPAPDSRRDLPQATVQATEPDAEV